MERAEEWLSGTDAYPEDAGRKYTFPGGSTRASRRNRAKGALSGGVLQFGYLEKPRDHENYQGSAWDFIGFDELTQFHEKQYRYLFSRLRRSSTSTIPSRMRAASNPGGVGHAWVRERFGIYRPAGALTGPRVCEDPAWIRQHDRAFLPAFLEDNPGLDVEDYARNLAELDSVTRLQLRRGDWEAREPGSFFRLEWFPVIDRVDAASILRRVRYWDIAATEPHAGNDDPDWTAGVLLAQDADGWIVEDVQHFRRRPRPGEARIKAVAMLDGRDVPIRIEEEPGSSGKTATAHYALDVLPGFDVAGRRPGNSKETRARPVSSKAELGLIRLVRGPWVQDFLDELEGFPDAEHDDQVDALSGAFSELTGEPGPPETGPKAW
jgi:predicted phage terminase large subunit-like protein